MVSVSAALVQRVRHPQITDGCWMVTDEAHLITGQARCRNDQLGRLAAGLAVEGGRPRLCIKRSAARNFMFPEPSRSR